MPQAYCRDAVTVIKQPGGAGPAKPSTTTMCHGATGTTSASKSWPVARRRS